MSESAGVKAAVGWKTVVPKAKAESGSVGLGAAPSTIPLRTTV